MCLDLAGNHTSKNYDYNTTFSCPTYAHIAKGNTQFSLEVFIFNDGILEGNESFFVEARLSDGYTANYTLVTIIDDDDGICKLLSYLIILLFVCLWLFKIRNQMDRVHMY